MNKKKITKSIFSFFQGSMEEDTTLPKGLQDWNKDRSKEKEKATN